jgi:SAM-dependent methyltransferase
VTPSLPADYFTRLYDGSDDPWQISSGWYERRKRALLMASLPRERFSVGFEPGCSNGELTVQLASRCDRLIAWDVVDDALTRTRIRTAELPEVEIRHGALPRDWPDEKADLIVLAEVGYYLDAADLSRAVDEAVDRLGPSGAIVAVHWRHPAPDYPLTGDEVHRLIDARDDLDRLGGYYDEDFLLDIWTHGPVQSVAAQTGLI